MDLSNSTPLVLHATADGLSSRDELEEVLLQREVVGIVSKGLFNLDGSFLVVFRTNASYDRWSEARNAFQTADCHLSLPTPRSAYYPVAT